MKSQPPPSRLSSIRSLRRKSAAGVLAICAIALLGGAAVQHALDTQGAKHAAIERMRVAATMAGRTIAAPLLFRDSATAEGMLHEWAEDPKILVVAAYDHDGKLFANYARDAVQVEGLAPATTCHTLESNGSIGVFRPIMLENESIGSVYIEQACETYTDRLLVRAPEIGALFLMGMVLAYLGSLRLRNSILGQASL